MATITRQIGKADVGCYLDSARGIYIGRYVQRFATKLGWEGEELKEDHEFYLEATQEAEDYINELCDDTVYAGSTENGDWGIWEIEAE